MPGVLPSRPRFGNTLMRVEAKATRLTRERAIGSQPPMRALHIASILFAFNLAACSDDDPKPADTASPDVSGDVADTSAPDTSGPDTTEPDTSEPDTTAPDIAEPDTAEPDAADTDTTPDTASCEYFDNPIILQCGQALTQFSLWEDFANPQACAPYFSKGEDRYDTIEALAQGQGCDASCVYIAFQAVDFIRCDGQGRSGFETFTAAGEGCLETVYRTSDGLFTDLCFWATYNCYCTEDPG